MSRVKDIDLGFNRITAAIKGFDGKGVEVGQFAPELATIGAHNELGAPKASVPERPAMRQGHDRNEAGYVKRMTHGVGRVIDGVTSPEAITSALGLVAMTDMKRSIIELRTPENADSTVARKKSSNPLVDEGTLVGAVSFDLVNDFSREGD